MPARAVRREYHLPDVETALAHVHAPDSLPSCRRPSVGSASTRRSVTQTVAGASAGPALAAELAPATPRPPSAEGLLADLRRAAALRAHHGQRAIGAEIAADLATATRCTGSCRATSAPARPSSRSGRCSRVVDAGGQAALLAPTEVLAAAAPPLDRARCSGRSRRPGARRRRHGTRVALLTGSRAPRRGARRCSTRPRARPASSSAPTPCCRSTCSSPTWASSSSTSSTASASSSATRCASKAADGARTSWS